MDEKPEPAPEPAASGNRWEPTDPDPGPHAEHAAPYADPQANPYVVPETSAAPPSRRTWLTRARAGVAGGAAAVLLAGGLGGFAIGRATVGHDDGRDAPQGVPTGFDRDGEHGFPGGPQLGQLPDNGQVPDMPRPDDGQHDDDGTDGSTT